MLKHGGVEVESSHYFLFIVLHTSFFFAVFFEWFLVRDGILWLSPLLVSLFLILQGLRVWCITSLGRKWNTKIIVIPDEPLIDYGPYKFVKHPNYIIVFFELLVIPLLFQAYVTAIIFPIMHLLVLMIRLPAEERALGGKF